MTAKREDKRKLLLACRPCGCWSLVMTVDDPTPPMGPSYQASALDMADFYKRVHKRKLTVREVIGAANMPPCKCEKCCSPTLFSQPAENAP